MRLLLDTHIWLWSLGNRSLLTKRVLAALNDSSNETWISAANTWEALLLNSKGRIELPRDLQSWLIFATANVQEAPITHEIVFVAHHLPLPHKDPADRFLAATAKVLGLTLVTQDPKLLSLGEISTLANL